jgi:hypothetical protein
MLFATSTIASETLFAPSVYSAQDSNRNKPRMAKRQRQTAVRLDLLQKEKLTLNLFDDVEFVAVRDEVVKNNGAVTWTGKIEEEKNSRVILTVFNNKFFGSVEYQEQLFEIKYSKDKVLRIQETDLSKTRLGCDPVDPLVDEAFSEEIGNLPNVAQETISTAQDEDSLAVIDLMVVYTPRARINAGGTDGMLAKVHNAIAKANDAYKRSGVKIELYPVHIAEVDYQETGNMSTTLFRLWATTDGYLNEVLEWRNTYGADLVTMLTTDANYCGLANVMTSTSSNFERFAFSVVHDDSRYACISNHSFTHELGHNQGSDHNIEDAYGGYYSYSYGHRICAANGFRTIMSYACSGVPRIGYFSNPSIYYNGDPTGVDEAADNSRSLNNTRFLVSEFRPTTVSRPPVRPTELTAIGKSDSEIVLEWVDNSNDETGFRVERSVDGNTWIQVKTLAADISTTIDTDLAQNTEYGYRIFSYNQNGVSNASEVVWAKTMAVYTTQVVKPWREKIQEIREKYGRVSNLRN